MKTILKTLIFFVIISLTTFGCSKDNPIILQSSIILHDKPLSVIEAYVNRKWKFQYARGGIAGMTIYDKYNSYMKLYPSHIILGNDSLGVYLNTPIKWIKESTWDLGYLYVLSYNHQNFAFLEIKDDTLVINDYKISDGFTYYYTPY